MQERESGGHQNYLEPILLWVCPVQGSYARCCTDHWAFRVCLINWFRCCNCDLRSAPVPTTGIDGTVIVGKRVILVIDKGARNVVKISKMWMIHIAAEA